jgi:hypothetical protein
MSPPVARTAASLLAEPPALLLAADRAPANTLLLVDLSDLGTTPTSALLSDVGTALSGYDGVRLGTCTPDQVEALETVAAALDLTLVETAADLPPEYVAVPDVAAATDLIARQIGLHRHAASILVDVLRRSTELSVADGLIAESLAYSLLLAGEDFAKWLADRPSRDVPVDGDPTVLISRDADVLHLSLNRPARHNAFNRVLRDELFDALEIALLDDSITSVHIDGIGPSFCSGGDLDEFGTTPDVVTAHLIRTQRSVGRRTDQLRDLITVTVHGSCIGAGVELPSFAGTVVAHGGTLFALPELTMGLIPGAGGTVSLPRRIGRWRTAWMALTALPVDAETALSWGLVDRLDS